MKIGYAVQGSTDRAFLRGLKERWCLRTTMVEGAFRGSTGLSLRREIPKICGGLFAAKRCDVIVFVSDADEGDWKTTLKRERAKVPPQYDGLVVYAIADRNIECWLCAEPNYLASRLGVPADSLRLADPKNAFEASMSISHYDRKEDEIAALVRDAPRIVLRQWLENASFAHFYDELRNLSNRRRCSIENIRESDEE